MNPFPSPLRQPVPAVVIDDQQERLSDKYGGVGRHERFERAPHVVHETGVERDKQGQHRTADECGNREGQQRNLRQISGQPVVAQRQGRFLGHQSEEFQQRAEERQRKDESAEIGVLLRHKPDRHPAVERADARIDHFMRRRGRRSLRSTGGIEVEIRRLLGKRGNAQGRTEPTHQRHEQSTQREGKLLPCDRDPIHPIKPLIHAPLRSALPRWSTFQECP